MKLKIDKRTLFTALLAVLAVICAVLAISFLIPTSRTRTASAEGNDHSHTGWTKLTSSNTTLSAGNYYLNENLSGNITVSSGTVTLCLNGKTLTGTGVGAVITISNGANFILCDCSGNDSGKITGGSNAFGGVRVYTTATFTMYGGTITGNTTTGYGGGVYVYNLGTFNMCGGVISGNTASQGANGVYTAGSTTFTMTGGYIADSISCNSTVTISGGCLSETVYSSVSSYIASGYTTVKTNSSTYPYVVVSNAEASHKHDDTTFSTVLVEGGTLSAGSYYLVFDLYLNSDITISSGTVYLCLNGYTLTGSGSGSVITVSNGAKLILCDCSGDDSGTITGGNASYGGGINVNKGTLTMYGGTIYGNKGTYGGGVNVSSGNTFTMYGGTISGNSSTYGGGVRVYGGTFTMEDGTITGNSSTNFGGINVSDGATFTMTGGTISNNKATSGNGGGVRVYNNSTFTMTGGTISGNSVSGNGGGVNIDSGTFIMSDGTISANKAKIGGGVHTAGTFTMSGGTISDNTASSNAGGVSVSGTFTMNGGTISGNTASSEGGGIRVNSTGMFTMNGGTITNNSPTAMYIYRSAAIINGGYINGTHYNNGGTITVYGGYFSSTAYNSFKSNLSSKSSAVNLSDFDSEYGFQPDEKYNSAYPYAVYAKGSYSIKDISVTYGQSYTPTVSGTYAYMYALYTWNGTTGTALPTDVGNYSVTATIISISSNGALYTSTADFSVTIVKKALTADMFSVTGSYTYNDDAQNATYTFKDADNDSAVLTSNDFDVTYSNNNDAGTATVTFTGKGNYSGSVALNYEIEKADYDTSRLTLKNLTVTYNGSAYSLAVSGLPDGVRVTYYYEGTSGTTYSKSTKAPTEAGTYTVTAVFIGDTVNYNTISSLTATLTIEKASYDTESLTLSDLTVTYDEQAHSLEVSGLPEGVSVTYYYEGTNGTLYEKSTTAPTDAGTYTVTAVFSGDANYNAIDDLTATLTIKKATVSLSTEDVEVIASITANVGDSLDDIELPEGWTWSSSTTFTKSGEYEVEVTYCAGDNYEAVTESVIVSVAGLSEGDVAGIVGTVIGCLSFASVVGAIVVIFLKKRKGGNK